jgi:paraquat-inducible protein A
VASAGIDFKKKNAPNMVTTAGSQMVCHECDLLIAVPALEIGQKAYCPRCNYLLAANRPHALTMVFAFAVSGLVFLLLSTAFPFLGFSASGQERTVTLLQSIAILVTEDLPSLAVIVFASIILIPGAFLIGAVYVSSALKINRPLPGTDVMLRWTLMLMPWSMAEIFLIGILVSFVKIVTIADVSLGLSFWSYVLFTVCMTVVMLYPDKRHLWERVRSLDDD